MNPSQIAAVRQAEAALRAAQTAINDWVVQYAGEMCGDEHVAETGNRIVDNGGTLAYTASVNATITAAMQALTAALALPGEDESSLLQDDLRELLAALGLPDGARPQSPHEVFQECLVVLRQKLALPGAQAGGIPDGLDRDTLYVDPRLTRPALEATARLARGLDISDPIYRKEIYRTLMGFAVETVVPTLSASPAPPTGADGGSE